MAGTKISTGETRLSAIVQAIRELFEGRSHATGSLTLVANVGTTTIKHPNFGPTSTIKLMPTTANAATAIATTYVTSKVPGQFVLTHANNAQTDRIFDYAFQG